MRNSLTMFAVVSMILLQLVSTTTIPDTTNKIEPKVVGGTPINIGQAPYQVSVRLVARDKRSYGSGHICGGVVISQRVVATAAHCIYNSDTKKYRKAGEFVLVMGSTYLSRGDANTQQYFIQQLIVHPNYNHGTLVNDIALIFFNGYIPWQSATVRALPLNNRSLPAGTGCVITGWGVTNVNNPSASNTLQLGSTPIVSYLNCAVGYGNLPRSKLCAGYMSGGIDACQGDSGGPLMCDNSLVGIVSYGVDCAKKNYPGVYTNVSYFNDWIWNMNKTLDYSVYKNGSVGLNTHGMGIFGMWLTILVIFVAGRKSI